MTYISGKEMIETAYKNKFAIGAFSAHNIETLVAILEAAKEEDSPVMIMIGQKVINTLGLEQMKKVVDAYQKNYDIPVSVHLDHSRDFAQVMEAVQLEFQSVMFDGSARTFEENVQITKAVAEVAKTLNIGSEGEIGKIGGTEDDITVEESDVLITTVEEAVEFINKTGVDYIALSIGTAHGIYKTEPRLRFERIKEISNEIKRPIVLHGGSGVPDKQVQKAIELGVAKVNVDTELRKAFTEGVADFFEANANDYTLASSLGEGSNYMKEVVKKKIHVFGSNGKASLFNDK